MKSFYPDEAALEKSYPSDIVSLIVREYGVIVSYYKAWKGWELALIDLRGSTEDWIGFKGKQPWYVGLLYLFFFHIL